ncbi:hypothetical protein [Arcanobacterium hippocoleae]|uniref:Uncharacterized protein n=1 Tax=Arcanobacterium hippocoleae TaxID=149017 RepID=A0ABU1T0F6_9ACTO|nr:hypothetical protein [Arcanobacterium hippocoleae]MDR6938853.1 hypothetical protein [Arcanobacterium hippocoleae]
MNNNLSRWIDGVGVVRAISYPGKSLHPAVRVTIDFNGEPLLLVFQSQTNLRAIDIGQSLYVQGNCVVTGAMRILYNPSYRIVS